MIREYIAKKALGRINELRMLEDLPVVGGIPQGVVNDGTDCPLARALSTNTDDSVSVDLENIDFKSQHFAGPYVAAFVFLFDTGFYPKLSSNTEHSLYKFLQDADAKPVVVYIAEKLHFTNKKLKHRRLWAGHQLRKAGVQVNKVNNIGKRFYKEQRQKRAQKIVSESLLESVEESSSKPVKIEIEESTHA